MTREGIEYRSRRREVHSEHLEKERISEAEEPQETEGESHEAPETEETSTTEVAGESEEVWIQRRMREIAEEIRQRHWEEGNTPSEETEEEVESRERGGQGATIEEAQVCDAGDGLVYELRVREDAVTEGESEVESEETKRDETSEEAATREGVVEGGRTEHGEGEQAHGEELDEAPSECRGSEPETQRESVGTSEDTPPEVAESSKRAVGEEEAASTHEHRESEVERSEHVQEGEGAETDLRDDFRRRVREVLEAREDDDGYTTDALSGRRIYRGSEFFQESEEEEERRRLRELFSELTEEEREYFKEWVRSQVRTEEELDELLEQYAERVRRHSPEEIDAARAHVRGEVGEVPDLLNELSALETERQWAAIVEEVAEAYQESERSPPWQLETREEYAFALNQHDHLRLRKTHEARESEVFEYFERIERDEDSEKPRLILELEDLELRRIYELVHSGPPPIDILSMRDVDELLQKNPDERERKGFRERYRRCKVYFEVKNQHDKRREDLAKEHKVGHAFIGYCRTGVEPTLIRNLRTNEEERIMRDWTHSETRESIERTLRQSRPVPEQSKKRDGVFSIDAKPILSVLSHLEKGKALTPEEILSFVNELHFPETKDEYSLLYIDLHSIPNHQDVAETIVRERILDPEHEDSSPSPKTALVGTRLYIWHQKPRHDELVEAYEDQFYYFRSKKEIVSILAEIQSRLNLEGSLHESGKHLTELSEMMYAVGEQEPNLQPITERTKRLDGRVVHLYLDITDRNLSDLEGRVVKITGINGQAGIRNPRFPSGKDLEILKARLAAIIISDCHLRASGRITYNEEHLERINRVQDILRHFGDINLDPVFRKGSFYEVHIQNQIGLMMIQEGMVPGNKTLNNPGLPRSFRSWSEEARLAYLEELIPEDGGFSASRGFSWTRSHALYDGSSSKGFRSIISNDEVDLVKEKGSGTKGLVDYSCLAYGELEALQSSENESKSLAARNMIAAIQQSRNRLIDDEREIAESLGFAITLSPSCVKYYPKTGRVSVKWAAATSRRIDAEKWAERCPPNDERKRRRALAWLRKRKAKKK